MDKNEQIAGLSALVRDLRRMHAEALELAEARAREIGRLRGLLVAAQKQLCELQIRNGELAEKALGDLTYGTLPTREEFREAFMKALASCDCTPIHGLHSNACDAGRPARFIFTNDPRVGTCALTCSELWAELNKALQEWGTGDESGSDADKRAEAAGQWCSGVLSALGFKWVGCE